MRHHNWHKYWKIRCKTFLSYISLDQDSSVNFIRGLGWFMCVISSLEKSLRRYFQAVDCLLVWTDCYFLSIELLSISLQKIGKVFIFYWVARMGWWIQNSSLECGLYMVIIVWSSGMWWSCFRLGDRCCEKN